MYTNSCYVRFPKDQLVCVGGLSMDDGPITIRAVFPTGRSMDALGIKPRLMVGRTLDGVQLGESVFLDTSDAILWNPPKIKNCAELFVIERRINSLVGRLETLAPNAGLAPLVRYPSLITKGETLLSEGQLVRIASCGVTQLVRGIRSGNGLAIHAGIGSLVGLGPGLTPSGDDLLAGMMIGMWVMAENSLHLRKILPFVERTIHHFAKSQTTAVSAALLGHAAAGVGSSSVHRFVQTLIEVDDSLDSLEIAKRISNFGHTSGWDCLAGLLIGIQFGFQAEGTLATISNNSRVGGNIYAD